MVKDAYTSAEQVNHSELIALLPQLVAATGAVLVLEWRWHWSVSGTKNVGGVARCREQELSHRLLIVVPDTELRSETKLLAAATQWNRPGWSLFVQFRRQKEALRALKNQTGFFYRVSCIACVLHNSNTNLFSGLVASVPVRAGRRPAGTGCSDLLHRAGLAFAIAELAYHNGWPRGGLPMLLGAARLGLQGLLEQLTGREPTSRSLIVLLEAFHQQPAVPTGITESLEAIEQPLWEALDKVDMAGRMGGYYEVPDKDIGRLTLHIGRLLKAISSCLFEP